VSDDFVRDLEEELVAAARFRAAHRRRIPRPRMSAPTLRRALAAVAALALLAALALVAAGRDGDDRVADDRHSTPPPAGSVVSLVPMLGSATCRDLDVRDVPAAGEFAQIGLFARTQHEPDAIPPPQGNVITYVPVRTFDPSESRLAGYRRLQTTIHAFPSLAVSTDGSCTPDDGPGICLVQVGNYRCFTRSQVAGAGALALTPDGWIVGIVPDGIERVILSANGASVTAEVVENVYAARLGVPAGTDVRVAPAPPGAGCAQDVVPELLARFAVLRRPPEKAGHLLPRAAVEALRHYKRAITEPAARFWGGGGDVEWWAVPVVPYEVQDTCAPATEVCVVAIPREGPADVFCGRKSNPDSWKIAPLADGRTLVMGLVPDGVSGARVTGGAQSGEIDARDNVAGGVLFPYRDGAKYRVEPIRTPAPDPAIVGVVDATGGDRAAAEQVLRTIRGAGFQYIDGILPGVKAQPRTDVYWLPDRSATLQQAESVAELVVADDVIKAEYGRTPRPVLSTEAGIVVVVGSER
jgi:hypothetical protein